MLALIQYEVAFWWYVFLAFRGHLVKTCSAYVVAAAIVVVNDHDIDVGVALAVADVAVANASDIVVVVVVVDYNDYDDCDE